MSSSSATKSSALPQLLTTILLLTVTSILSYTYGKSNNDTLKQLENSSSDNVSSTGLSTDEDDYVSPEDLKDLQRMKSLRAEERRGRINAEIKLRKTVKLMEQVTADKNINVGGGGDPHQKQNQQQQQQQQQQTSSQSTPPTPTNYLPLIPIGHITSPFLTRTGTPRQGSVAQSTRGYIQLCPGITGECLDGIEGYSHIWIIFSFHANTDSRSDKNKDQKGKGEFGNLKTKIAPPRGPPGVKVGCLATRSPHRPNNVGLSLVNVISLDVKKRQLWISGLDLCHGTPVYDVKPVVPWDVPTFFSGDVINVDIRDDEQKSSSDVVKVERNTTNYEYNNTGVVKVNKTAHKFHTPEWVWKKGMSNIDEASLGITKNIIFTSSARDDIKEMYSSGNFQPLYGPTNNSKSEKKKKDGKNGGAVNKTKYTGDLDDVIQAISEVLRQDPRQTRMRNKVGTEEKTKNVEITVEPYRIVFCNTVIEFVVTEGEGVSVRNVRKVVFDESFEGDGVGVIRRTDF